MVEPPSEVRDHYEAEIVEAERLSRGAGQLELVRTQEIVRRHLPPGSLRIHDVGGGAGVHAAWLADDGHAVHVVDPMPSHVEAAQRLASSTRRITAELGDARDLAAESESADAVLLLGPLYHLTDGADRRRALAEAARVVLERWDAEVRDAILFAARAVESEPSLVGASAHLLMVARRPAS